MATLHVAFSCGEDLLLLCSDRTIPRNLNSSDGAVSASLGGVVAVFHVLNHVNCSSNYLCLLLNYLCLLLKMNVLTCAACCLLLDFFCVYCSPSHQRVTDHQ
jgi:hypothetical protein